MERPSITFTQVSDPEMLSTAVRRLKSKQTITRMDNKYEVNQEINQVTNTKLDIKTCSKCQHNNPVGSNFRNKCGNPLAVACNKCGRTNPSGSLFCSLRCGNEIDWEGEYITRIKVCPKCNKEYDTNANYCQYHFPRVSLIEKEVEK